MTTPLSRGGAPGSCCGGGVLAYMLTNTPLRPSQGGNRPKELMNAIKKTNYNIHNRTAPQRVYANPSIAKRYRKNPIRFPEVPSTSPPFSQTTFPETMVETILD